MISVADLLAVGLDLPAPEDIPAVVVPEGTHCALSGEALTRGYPVQQLVTGATAEFLDTWRSDVHGYASENVARCIKSSNPRAGNPCARSHLVFEDGTYYGPLINRVSAEEHGRPCWSDLVRAVYPARSGERCLVLLTTDTKKRLWPQARVTQLGERTTVYIHDSGNTISTNRVLSWPDLLACLTLLEDAYTRGFSKESLRVSLYRQSALLTQIGLAATQQLERGISPWRTRPEFVMALLIAQRQEKS